MRLEAPDIQDTIKRGIILYFIIALVAVPSGICSHQHLTPGFELSVIDPYQVVYGISSETVLADRVGRCFPETPQVKTIAAEEATELEDVEQEDLPPFHDYIMRAAQTYNVDPFLIRAIILAESSNNPQAVSKRGARGLMQLMPRTARYLGIKDSFDPALNIDGGVRYFRQLLDRFDGDEALALAAYNAGSRYVRKYQGVPPFRATRIYIKKVLKYREQFEKEMVLRDQFESAT